MTQRYFFHLFCVLLFLPSVSMAEQAVDLVIRNGLVITMDEKERILDPGWIAVSSGEIVAVGEGDGWERFRKADTRVVDASGAAVLPGLVNTHTHVPMVLFRGFADDLDGTTSAARKAEAQRN